MHRIASFQPPIDPVQAPPLLPSVGRTSDEVIGGSSQFVGEFNHANEAGLCGEYVDILSDMLFESFHCLPYLREVQVVVRDSIPAHSSPSTSVVDEMDVVFSCGVVVCSPFQELEELFTITGIELVMSPFRINIGKIEVR